MLNINDFVAPQPYAYRIAMQPKSTFNKQNAFESTSILEHLIQHLENENKALPYLFSHLYRATNEEIAQQRERLFQKSIEEILQDIEALERTCARIEQEQKSAKTPLVQKFWTVLLRNVNLTMNMLDIYAYPKEEASKEADEYWVAKMGEAIKNGDISKYNTSSQQQGEAI